ncbi:MAG: T9SS type A sorting domain-containing protein [Flavobacteriales bacterium]|nr:T9SS type A sorting domain-containing protein [Flavobacteriales bacterium]
MEGVTCGISYTLSYDVTPPVFAINPPAGTGSGNAPTIDLEASTVTGQVNFEFNPTNAYYRIEHPGGPLVLNLQAEHAGATVQNYNVRLRNSATALLSTIILSAGGNSTPLPGQADFGARAAAIYYIEVDGSPCGMSFSILCNDDDEDGVCNASDLCPGTPGGEGVNSDGCACSQLTVDDGDPCTLDECTNGIVSNTFQDADNDGTCDFLDGCPNDPNKIAPGQCGCGVPDTDTDGDGTADCIDGCPNDPDKTAPGICGCGVSDVDSDGDGVADCIDGCPNDPDKIIPGICGCGVADTDTDNDGTPDCNDLCPNDPNKTEPGICGCGVSDADSDGDGVADCIDGCPNDPNKTEPGICGCGVSDVDSDGDGVADCNDGCPNDPDKTEPGICGCGASDVDTDGDGVADCNDPCPLLAGLQPGDACDDGNANTINDTVNANCLCVGVLPDEDCAGVPGGPAQPGTACDDGDDCTINDVYDANCDCAGTFQDSDGDGVCDADDGCPNDPDKTAPGICGCGVSDVDSDGDGTADCNDGCPNDPDKTAPGDCGCGNPEPGATCNDGDENTENDVITAGCECAGTPIEPEFDCPLLEANIGDACDDLDENTENDTVNADCDCVGTPIEPEFDCPLLEANIGDACDDLDENTENDTVNADCDCVGTPIEPEFDCPLLEANIGDVCDAGPGYINGVVTEACDCVGEPTDCIHDLVIDFATDANGGQISWSISPLGGGSPVCSGSGLPSSQPSVLEACCLPDGCYRLVVTDAGGDGIAGGGYILRTLAGDRIIDSRDNGAFGSGSALAPGEGFCLPMGTDRPIASSCDRNYWVSGQYLVAAENAIVSDEWQVGDQTDDGYEFWFFDPHGSLSFRKLRNHATSDGYNNVGATRACHIKLNNWAAANHLQDLVLYNVRIRSVVNGVYAAYGPACRMTLDPVTAACPPAKLNDVVGHPNFSCGVTRTWGGPNQAANRLFAMAIAGANLYEWEFTNLPGDASYLAVLQTTTVQRHLNWASQPAMQPGVTYNVRVRARKNISGVPTWCTWGEYCTVTISAGAAPGNENMLLDETNEAQLTIWPNPNNGQQLWIAMDEVTTATVAIDLFDLSGQRVMAQELPAQGGQLFTMLQLDGLAPGTYLVAITAGDERQVKRLVVQR